MANQTRTQGPMAEMPHQHRPAETPRQPRMIYESHGQGQVRNPETDRRLKANRG